MLGRKSPSLLFLKVGEGKTPTMVSSLNLALWELARTSGTLGTVQGFGELGELCLQVGPPP